MEFLGVYSNEPSSNGSKEEKKKKAGDGHLSQIVQLIPEDIPLKSGNVHCEGPLAGPSPLYATKDTSIWTSRDSRKEAYDGDVFRRMMATQQKVVQRNHSDSPPHHPDESSSEYIGPWRSKPQKQASPADLFVPLSHTSGDSQSEPAPDAQPETKRPRSSAPVEPQSNVNQKDEESSDDEETLMDEHGHRVRIEEYSRFHGKQERDYQGRTYITAPTHLKNREHECFRPTKVVHTWHGHTSAVQAIRLFPGTGHLLLSGSSDTRLKLWDVSTHRSVLRTMYGHSKAIRDVDFSPDGRTFLSSSYDRTVKLWDTETGACLGRWRNGSVANAVRFHPRNPGEFVAGYANRKLYQWDARQSEAVQIYESHEGGVNSVTFFDDGKRFMSSADDKSLRIWEYGLPVVIKYHQDPFMHSMPAVTLHPSGKWLLAQSLDSQIQVYSTRRNLGQNRKKLFTGHDLAGHGCRITVSPDGKFVACGDGLGELVIWSWKMMRVIQKLKCHDRVVIDAIWHPIEPSSVITAGWDGKIKMLA